VVKEAVEVQEAEVREIDLRDVFRILKKRWTWLVVLPLVAALVSALISIYVLEPLYESSTILMVGKTYEGEQAYLLQYNDVLMANQLVKTYSEIAKSRAVAEQVIKEENLSISPEQFKNIIKVEPFNDTQLIKITITDPDPYTAERLANRSANVFMEKVVQVMKVDNVNVIDVAQVPVSPVKPNVKLNILVAGLLGLMAALGLAFLFEFMDQTIKTADDVSRYLDLPVLGAVPYINE
jgi:capsular polysaccharide biosynthesis protein